MALLAVPLNPIPAAEDSKAAAAEKRRLEGAWECVRVIDEDGKPGTSEDTDGYSWEFKGNGLTVHGAKGDRGKKMTYRIDPTKRPKWIDVDIAPKADLPVAEGIYRLDGDELTVCIMAGRNGKVEPIRPTEFKAKPPQMYRVFTFKRVKPKAQP
jgi:uncharacterized protein (TIGR03067 family)